MSLAALDVGAAEDGRILARSWFESPPSNGRFTSGRVQDMIGREVHSRAKTPLSRLLQAGSRQEGQADPGATTPWAPCGTQRPVRTTDRHRSPTLPGPHAPKGGDGCRRGKPEARRPPSRPLPSGAHVMMASASPGLPLLETPRLHRFRPPGSRSAKDSQTPGEAFASPCMLYTCTRRCWS